MTLSVPQIALAARKLEAEELKRLQSSAHLVGVTGLMIHVLQKERGASSLFLASSGRRFREEREALILESESVEALLRESIESESLDSGSSNARILSLMAWILLGLEALPELRTRVSNREMDGNACLTAFSRLIAGLISLIFEVADAAANPAVSQLLVALFNLVQGKELAGQERAVGALCFGSGIVSGAFQQRLAFLADAQERNFRLFEEFAGEPFAGNWHRMQETPGNDQLDQMRRLLTETAPGALLDANLSNRWFERCSERIANMWELQRDLVDALQATCESLIHAVEHEILDSEGLIGTIEEKPPVRAEYVDRFFDPEVPVEDAFRFMPPVKETQEQAHSIIDLLQLQSRRLAGIEDELSAARRALDERRIIERAKGILMARFNLTEDEAYKKMRKTSMDKNLRLVEVAESVQALVSFP
jgi:hypothetical protein